MIGAPFSYKVFPRDRLVSICKSSAKADVFEKIVKEMPNINKDLLVLRMQSIGVSDAEQIVTEVDAQIEERANLLKSISLLC